MEETDLRIYQGKTEAFLVCNKSLENIDAPFFKWLRDEDFTFAGKHGNFGCHWVHINITRKQYAYGMPGVPLVKPIGNHAITIEEFMAIYGIFKKYEGKKPLVFHSVNCDYDV